MESNVRIGKSVIMKSDGIEQWVIAFSGHCRMKIFYRAYVYMR